LMSQTLEEAEIFSPHLFNDVGLLKFSKPRLDVQLLIGSYWAVSKHAETTTFKDGMFDLIVKDEDHEGLSERRKHAFNLSLSKTFKTSFTATQAYSIEKSLEAAGYKCVYRLPFDVAVAKGILSPTRNSFIEFEDPELSLKNIRLTATGELDARELGKVINNQGVARAMAHFYATFTDPDTNRPLFGRSGINFCSDIEHAKAVSEEFNVILGDRMKPGVIASLPIWGEISSRKLVKRTIGEMLAHEYGLGHDFDTLVKLDRIVDPRLEDIRADMPDGILTAGRVLTWLHRKGHVLFLSTADYLTRGYNNRRAEIGFDFVPRISLVAVGQIPGRLTRKDAQNLSKVAQMYSLTYPDTPFASQIFPADFWGRAALFPDGQGTLSKEDRIISPAASYTPPQDDLLAFKLHFGQREVEEYVKARNIKRLKALNPLLNEVTPPVFRALLRINLHRFDDFLVRVQKWARENDYLGESHTETDMQMMAALSAREVKMLLRGGNYHRRYYSIGEGGNVRLRAYSLTAMAVAGVLKTPPQHLFGPLDKDAILDEQREVKDLASHHNYPNDHDFDLDLPERDVFDMTDPDNELACEDYVVKLAVDPLEKIEYDQRQKAVSQALNTLTPREEFILRAHFGIGRANDNTFEEIGNIFGVTRERIRQLEVKALRKLKHPLRSKKLRPFAEDEGKTYREICRDLEAARTSAREHHRAFCAVHKTGQKPQIA